MSLTISQSVFAILIIVVAANVCYNICFHQLRRVPGSRLHAATRLPLVYAVLTGKLPFHLHRLHQKYGPVVRTAPNEVSFIDEEACRTIYVRKNADGHICPKNYDMWSETTNYFTHTVFLAGRNSHGRMQKVFAAAFSERILQEHESTIISNVDHFVNQLYRKADGAEHSSYRARVDLDERFHWLAFDIVSEFVFGSNFDCLGSSTHRKWLRNLSKTWMFIAIISSMKQIVSVATYLLEPTGLLQSRIDALALLDAKTEELLTKPPLQKPTLLTIGRSCMADGGNEQRLGAISKVELMANAALFAVAGTDTVATVLPAVVYFLLRNPQSLASLLHEVSDIEREVDITPARVREMQYLDACIQEAMRLYPAVPEGLPRLVFEHGQEISGYWLPPGIEWTAIQVSNYAAYRSPTNFESPDAFIPERWLRQSSHNKHDGGRGVFHPFSTGPRRCIAQNFAMAEMRLSLVKLLWHFDIDLDCKEDWLDQSCFLLWKRKPLMVKLTARSQEGCRAC